MSTIRSEMAKILRSLWNIVLEFLLKRKMMAPPLMMMPETMKMRMEMWVALQLSARLSTIVCIQGFELMTAAAADDDDDDATRFDTLKSLLTLPRHTDSGNPPHQLLYVKRYLKKLSIFDRVCFLSRSSQP